MDGVYKDVAEELDRARQKFPNPFCSNHEGHSIIKEEYDEFWTAVKHEFGKRVREEAIQLAAMAIRFLEERAEVLEK